MATLENRRFILRSRPGKDRASDKNFEGRIKYRHHIVEGLEKAPSAVNMLFDGANQGKLVVKVSEEPPRAK